MRAAFVSKLVGNMRPRPAQAKKINIFQTLLYKLLD